MNNEKKKNIIIGILITIIIFLTILCVLALTGNIGSKNNDKNDKNDQTIQENNNQNVNYNSGDLINIIKLSSVEWSAAGNDDLSKWYVLEDDGEYLTLISDDILYKDSTNNLNTLSNLKELLKNNGINFGTKGEVRLINENDLVSYFGCDINNMTCSKINPWLNNNTLTSVEKNNKIIILNSNNTLELGEKENILYPVNPIIKILKNSI